MFAALGDGTPLSVKGTMEVDRTDGCHWPWSLRGHISAAPKTVGHWAFLAALNGQVPVAESGILPPRMRIYPRRKLLRPMALVDLGLLVAI